MRIAGPIFLIVALALAIYLSIDVDELERFRFRRKHIRLFEVVCALFGSEAMEYGSDGAP